MHISDSACIAKPTLCACSWWWLCYMSKHILLTVLALPSQRRVPCSWWWLCYMSKRILLTVLVLPSQRRASCTWWWLCYMSKRTLLTVLVLPSQRRASCSWWWLCYNISLSRFWAFLHFQSIDMAMDSPNVNNKSGNCTFCNSHSPIDTSVEVLPLEQKNLVGNYKRF